MKVSEILKITKAKMKGRWQLAFTVTVVVASIITIVPLTLTPALGGLERIADLVWLFAVSLPVRTGASWLFLDLFDGKKGDLNSIFDVFLDLKRISTAWLLKMVLITAQLFLFFIPGLIAEIKYSQMNFILKDNPEMDGLAAIRLSKEMMRGHKVRYCLLYLNIFWPVILIMTVGIFIMVNHLMTMTLYSGELLIDQGLLRLVSQMIFLSNLVAHALNAYARPAFAVFYRNLNPVKDDEEVHEF